jgi:uncharacterized protein YbaP (TraB family)
MYYQIEATNVRLAGSMHFVPAGSTVPRWVVDAYDWSEDVYLEANQDDLPQHAILPHGQLSESKLAHDLWASVLSRWPPNHPYGVPGPLKLWFIAIVLALAGVPLSHGVENLIRERAKAGSRTLKYLEGVGEFARLMDSIPDADYAKAFPLILGNSVEVRARYITEAYTAWVSGQVDALTAAMQASPLTQFPALRSAVFDARNKLWLPRITNMLGTQRRTVIFIGAGHLGSPNGLLALLAGAGHVATPLLNN